MQYPVSLVKLFTTRLHVRLLALVFQVLSKGKTLNANFTELDNGMLAML